MNSFGRIFRINIFGESHGQITGILIDGCPAGIKIDSADFEQDLSRRKPGNKGTSTRIEKDTPMIQSGVFNGYTTGAPILIYFENINVNSEEYEKNMTVPRPSHADFIAKHKFNNFNDYRGGGMFSGRLTIGLVAAGVIAKKIISPIIIESKILSVGGSLDINYLINEAMNSGDSLGGLIETKINNIPIGLGEPFFDSVESVLSHLIFSIPGIKGIEFGSGFKSAEMKGSEHNDVFETTDGKSKTNHSGGINGGITNGNEIVFRVAVKPASSISKSQQTLNFKTNKIEELTIKGRHDTCFALRVPPIIEAVSAIVLTDLLMIDRGIQGRNL